MDVTFVGFLVYRFQILLLIGRWLRLLSRLLKFLVKDRIVIILVFLFKDADVILIFLGVFLLFLARFQIILLALRLLVRVKVDLRFVAYLVVSWCLLLIRLKVAMRRHPSMLKVWKHVLGRHWHW